MAAERVGGRRARGRRGGAAAGLAAAQPRALGAAGAAGGRPAGPAGAQAGALHTDLRHARRLHEVGSPLAVDRQRPSFGTYSSSPIKKKRTSLT